MNSSNKFLSLGKYMYLLGLAELAVYNFVKGDFAMTRPPALPGTLSGINPVMAYITGGLLLISIVAIVINKLEINGLFIIAALVFLCATSRHIFNVWRDPVNGCKTLWLIGGALLILSTLNRYKKYQQKILYFNIIVLFLFFYHCGVAHFQFTDFVKELIPAYIPFKTFFAYLGGVCLLAAAIGLLVNRFQRLAALLAGVQITGWFFLLHIPRAVMNHGDEWIGVGESLAVAGICFMLYAIPGLRNQPANIDTNNYDDARWLTTHEHIAGKLQ